MQSMKFDIDDMYNKCKEFEDATKEANDGSDKNDIDIRDVGKKSYKDGDKNGRDSGTASGQHQQDGAVGC